MAVRRSPHEVRQKRQIRHMVASGEDMPPLGYVDRSRFFKERGRATDQGAYWAGPVTERPQPWRDKRRHTPSSHQSLQHQKQQQFMQRRQYTQPLQRNDKGMQPVERKQVLPSPVRRRRPSSACSITVLSMLDFERKVVMQASRSTPKLSLIKRRTRPSTATVSSKRHTSPNSHSLETKLRTSHTPRSRSESGLILSAKHHGKYLKKSKKKLVSNKHSSSKLLQHPLNENSIASSLLSNRSLDSNDNSNDTAIKDGGDGKQDLGPVATEMTSLEWAKQFIADVKNRLSGEDALFEEFIRAVQESDGSIGSLLSTTKALLTEHDDLYLSFKDFVLRQSEKLPAKSNDASIPMPNTSPKRGASRRSTKKRAFTWLLDVAKTTAPTVLSRNTLERLSCAPIKHNLKDMPVLPPDDPSKKATGRYQGSGGGRFSTAFPMSDLERKILDASRLPGPLDYQDPKKCTKMSGGRFSTAKPKSEVDWIIYHSKAQPGPLDYMPCSVRKNMGVKFSDANPKSYLDWAIYNAQQVPGPLRYDISKCL